MPPPVHRRVPGQTSAAALVSCVLVLAGCTVGSGERAATAPATPATGTTFSQSLADAQLVDRHPNGAVLSVRGIAVRPNSVALDVSLINGYVEEIRLVDDALFRDRDTYLVDDFGNPYRYDHRGSNPDLRIAPGQELTGSVVFLGRVPAEATTFSLKTNVADAAAAVDVTDRDRDTDIPSFFVDGIPIP